jgi:hypothetical protein
MVGCIAEFYNRSFGSFESFGRSNRSESFGSFWRPVTLRIAAWRAPRAGSTAAAPAA